jgi:hypothetical protein
MRGRVRREHLPRQMVAPNVMRSYVLQQFLGEFAL